MDKNSKILVTGANGMVGSALVNSLKNAGYTKIILGLRKDLNLLDKEAVKAFFNTHTPDYVFMLAAKVGGIGANMSDPVGFLSDNLNMTLNLFEACYNYKVKKNLFLGSSCIYPKDSKQPMKEDYLLTGPLEPTNEGYALAKIVGIKLAEYYYKQYGMLTICPMPSNIYGTNDHFDLARSHVLSALVKRFVDAIDDQQNEIVLWGDGEARREFIHVADVSDALIFLMNSYESTEIINLGTGVDISIKELAELICKVTNYKGQIVWDVTKPNGMLRKCMDITKIGSLGFKAKISLLEGIQKTVQEYVELKNKKEII